jgi:hypothetical protein
MSNVPDAAALRAKYDEERDKRLRKVRTSNPQRTSHRSLGLRVRAVRSIYVQPGITMSTTVVLNRAVPILQRIYRMAMSSTSPYKASSPTT